MSVIVTHDGSFHPDEVMACAVLTKLFPSYTIIRSREPEILHRAKIVVDVGGVYDPDHYRYDHHLPSPPLRPDGTPYSSIGLIWKHYGHEFVSSLLPKEASSFINDIYRRINDNYISPIDAKDNGLHHEFITSIDRIVFDLRPRTDDVPLYEIRQLMDDHFTQAVTIARMILCNIVKNYYHDILDQKEYDALFEQNDDITITKRDLHAARFAHTDVKFLIHPKEIDRKPYQQYHITCVPFPHDHFSQKIPLPKAWAGLKHPELAQVSGIKTATYLHHKCFFGITQTLEDAYAMCHQAIKEHEQNK